MKTTFIIKLGGSVITHKDQSVARVRKSTLLRLVKEVKNAKKVLPKAGFLIVHGAGSFGHPLAKKYNLAAGMRTHEQTLGFSLTTQAMLKLNSFVVSAFHKQNLPAVSFPPHTFVSQSGREIERFDIQLIEQSLEKGQIPVLFGDMVLDKTQGCSILSGDTIVSYLSKKLKVDKVIYLSNVDGVFEKDPRINPSARLIPSVGNKNLEDVLSLLLTSSNGGKSNDVTGEMYGKLLSVRKFLPQVKVYVANGLKKGVLENILLNKKVRSTLIHFS
ncbi:MAG: isopentenyl phosphate kinase family protein [Candidatus Blackburnbacteria bacterium]|nr:isopentenyl phosphate kinase family protein [Candidatus Blackburnbacteria bacterium]